MRLEVGEIYCFLDGDNNLRIYRVIEETTHCATCNSLYSIVYLNKNPKSWWVQLFSNGSPMHKASQKLTEQDMMEYL